MNDTPLDDKLRMIMQSHLAPPDEVDQAVAQIKQAFTDAGYVNVTDRGGLQHVRILDEQGSIDYMTGQEWYDRFKAELANKHFRFFANPDDLTNTLMIVEDAARRAANIEDKPQGV